MCGPGITSVVGTLNVFELRLLGPNSSPNNTNYKTCFMVKIKV